MTIVLCSKGYPGNYKIKKKINKIDSIDSKKKTFIYHSGTKIEDNQLFSNGGRVLSISSTGNNFSKIRKKILKLIKKINWKHGFFRRDIGWRVVKKNENY